MSSKERSMDEIADSINDALLIAGALNWASVAFLNTNLVDKVTNNNKDASNVVYGLVGLAGAYRLLKVASGKK